MDKSNNENTKLVKEVKEAREQFKSVIISAINKTRFKEVQKEFKEIHELRKQQCELLTNLTKYLSVATVKEMKKAGIQAIDNLEIRDNELVVIKGLGMSPELNDIHLDDMLSLQDVDSESVEELIQIREFGLRVSCDKAALEDVSFDIGKSKTNKTLNWAIQCSKPVPNNKQPYTKFMCDPPEIWGTSTDNLLFEETHETLQPMQEHGKEESTQITSEHVDRFTQIEDELLTKSRETKKKIERDTKKLEKNNKKLLNKYSSEITTHML